MSTFVLVHGAYHGGWCWHKVVALLEREGHDVVAVDLPGHGRNAGSKATYAAYVEHVTKILRQQAEPVVLVGHSMGGAIVTGVAEAAPETVGKLVYLSAFIAPSGATMEGPLSARAEGDGFIPLEPDGLRLLYQDCSPQDVALARLCLTTQAVEPLTAAVDWTPERWGRIPRLFVGCLQDLAFPLEAQRDRVASVPGTEVVELDCGHSPFFSMPEELTRTLLAFAARAG